MLKRLRERRKDEKGFTLMELVIVVAIIGILTAIAIPVYGHIQATARVNALHEAADQAVKELTVKIGGTPTMADAGEYVDHPAENEGGISASAGVWDEVDEDYDRRYFICAVAESMVEGEGFVSRRAGDPYCEELFGSGEGFENIP
ncbi:prepilin-type N-terminal cleavage/methylation domain-containing protein [Microbacterium sp. KR10-403]|uniref:prepilin-type N-terminal cleavage/methylation domain-containing protein n=1 Tax=Microbacterium sp. KR10-403 TaxID=3158581 RepID=UPI0032E3E33C